MKKGCLIAVSLFMFFMTGYGRCSADEAGGYSLIIAKHSGKCLDVNGASTGDSEPFIQHSCHGGDNQLFSLMPAGGRYYSIVAKHSGKCLDVNGASTGDSASIIQHSCHGGDNQLWRIESR